MSDLPSLARLSTNVSTLQLTDLPPEIHALIAKIVGGNDPCNKLRRLCEANRHLCSEEVYRTACSHFRYNTVQIRDDFLATRPARIRQAAAANPWRVCFWQLCNRPKLTDDTFKDAIDFVCTPSNNMTHPEFGHISYWDVSKVTNMRKAFSHKYTFNQNITLWNVSNVKNMNAMFYEAHEFNQPLEWDVSNVKTMRSMFAGAMTFNQPLKWDVSNVKDMSYMFFGARAFNNFDRPLDWDVSGVTMMAAMFYGAEAFNQPLDWNVRNVKSMHGMFTGARAFNQPPDTIFARGRPNQANTAMFHMFDQSGQTQMPSWYDGT